MFIGSQGHTSWTCYWIELHRARSWYYCVFWSKCSLPFVLLASPLLIYFNITLFRRSPFTFDLLAFHQALSIVLEKWHPRSGETLITKVSRLDTFRTCLKLLFYFFSSKFVHWNSGPISLGSSWITSLDTSGWLIWLNMRYLA